MERAEVKVVVNKLVETVEAEYSAESARLVLARISQKLKSQIQTSTENRYNLQGGT